jgi:hypothetical protein
VPSISVFKTTPTNVKLAWCRTFLPTGAQHKSFVNSIGIILLPLLSGLCVLLRLTAFSRATFLSSSRVSGTKLYSSRSVSHGLESHIPETVAPHATPSFSYPTPPVGAPHQGIHSWFSPIDATSIYAITARSTSSPCRSTSGSTSHSFLIFSL